MEASFAAIAPSNDLQLQGTASVYGQNRHLADGRIGPLALCKQEVTGSNPVGSTGEVLLIGTFLGDCRRLNPRHPPRWKRYGRLRRRSRPRRVVFVDRGARPRSHSRRASHACSRSEASDTAPRNGWPPRSANEAQSRPSIAQSTPPSTQTLQCGRRQPPSPNRCNAAPHASDPPEPYARPTAGVGSEIDGVRHRAAPLDKPR